MARKDWTLLTLSFAKGRSLTPVQLQKALFLLGQEFSGKLGEFYSFLPHFYGPFDANIYRDAQALAHEGLAVMEPELGRSWSKYQISPQGVRESRRVQKRLPKRPVRYLKAVVEWILPLSFEAIVTTIYKHYPEYRVNSVFQGPR